MGLCVWLDFKFACSAYPAFDEAFMENVRLEARDNLRRLRDHPCIAVWCGNNEISLMTKEDWLEKSMGRVDYDKLFKSLLAGQVQQFAPQANYVSGSPDCGDTHYWEVWHGGKSFEAYRSLTGFMSEFGFQSFPEPRTVRSFTAEWTPHRGGLTMYGGRLSSLMLLSGRFRDGGELSLRHTACSSPDITEQGAAKIHIFGSSIRGLSRAAGWAMPSKRAATSS